MEKLPPNSMEAEEALLGAGLIAPEYLDMVEVKPSDFFREKNGWVWDVMLTLYESGREIDFLTVCDELEARKQLDEVGGPTWVTGLINAVPTSSHIQEYAKIVVEKSIRRQMISAASKIVVAAFDESTDIEDVHSTAEHEVMSVGQADREEPEMRELMTKTFEGIENPEEALGARIFTELTPIDVGTFGIEDGRYWLSAAVSGTGKSVVAINIAARLPDNSGCVYFCPEQPPQEITNMALAAGTPDISPLRIKLLMVKPEHRRKFAASVMDADTALRNTIYGSGMTFDDLVRDITKDELAQLRMARHQLNRKKIWPMSPGNLDVFALRRVLRRKRAELTRLYGPDAFLFVVWDGLGLFKKRDPSDTVGSLMQISQQIKKSAIDDIRPGAMFVNHHLNRGVFSQAGTTRHYHMGHLRDAPVENDADVIVIFDRESVWANTDAATPRVEPLRFVYLKNRQTARTFSSTAIMDTLTLRVS